MAAKIFRHRSCIYGFNSECSITNIGSSQTQEVFCYIIIGVLQTYKKISFINIFVRQKGDKKRNKFNYYYNNTTYDKYFIINLSSTNN